MKATRIVLLLMGVIALMTIGCDQGGTLLGPDAPEETAQQADNGKGDVDRNTNKVMPIDDETYTLAGVVYVDINENGIREQSETRLEGISIVLNDYHEAQTDEDGYFVFTDLQASDYWLAVDLPVGLTTVDDYPANVAVDNQDVYLEIGITLCDSIEDYPVEGEGGGLGFWRHNIEGALEGRQNGIQIEAQLLEHFTSSVASLGMTPFHGLNLAVAYFILDQNGQVPVNNLARHLLAAEYNFFRGRMINQDPLVTYLFLMEGEYMLMHSDEFSTSELLAMKDRYEAFNEGGEGNGGGNGNGNGNGQLGGRGNGRG